jgi:hypothetical protein
LVKQEAKGIIIIPSFLITTAGHPGKEPGKIMSIIWITKKYNSKNLQPQFKKNKAFFTFSDTPLGNLYSSFQDVYYNLNEGYHEIKC